MLAGRAVSVPTGTEQLDGFAAALALIEDGAHALCSAVDDGADDLMVVRRDAL